MKHNGMHVLNVHVPALMRRELIYLRGREFLGQMVALCFLPYAGFITADTIDDQARRFQEIETTLLIVASGARPLHRLWGDQSEKPWTTVLADPCGRLHRSFGVAVSVPSSRCHTFVIDREGILRLRVRHDFVESDLETLRKIVLNRTHRTDARETPEKATDIKTDFLPV